MTEYTQRMPAPVDLSAIMIAKDEEHDLPHALRTLEGLASEIVVVVDHGSSDKTEEIARRFGAKVQTRQFDNYAAQKQAALKSATRAWVLSIDADERVTAELREEIRRVLPIAPADVAGYELPFEVFFLGRRLRHGGLGSERHIRLFRREAARFKGGELHEGIELQGRVLRLRERVRHIPYRDLSEYLAKMDAYTSLAAMKYFRQGRRFHAWQHLLLPWEFFYRSVIRLGFLDGREGFVWAGLSAFHRWLKYVKLGEISS